MNIEIKEEEVELVRNACKDVLSDPKRGNIVHTKKLVERDSIKEYFSDRYNGYGSNAAIGTILSDADWATYWRKGKYMLESDEM